MAADFVQRGRDLVARGQYSEAVKVCRLGLLAHPADLQGRLLLGSALMALERHDEVLAEMRVALEMEGRSAPALGLQGEALLRKGDVQKAVEVLARARQLAPDSAELRALHAEAVAALGRAGGRPAGLGRRDGAFAVEEAESQEPTQVTPPPVADEMEATLDGRGLAGVRPVRFAPSLQEVHDGPTESSPPPRSQLRAAGLQADDFAEEGTEAPTRLRDRSTLGAALEAAAPGRATGEELRARHREPPRSGQRDVPREPPREARRDPVSRRGATPAPATAPGIFSLPALRPAPPAPPQAAFAAAVVGGGAAALPGPGLENAGAGARPRRRGGVQPTGRRTWAATYLLFSGVVLVGAVLGGLFVRKLRLDRQVREAHLHALRWIENDTYLGYQRAEEVYDLIVRSTGEASHRATLARIRAGLAAEFGVELERMNGELAAVASIPQADSLSARAYAAIAIGDARAASAAADALAQNYPDEPGREYLGARAALLHGNVQRAVELLRAALTRQQRPRLYVALAEAEAAAGRLPEALAALDQAAQLVPGHPAALVLRARILARARALPRDSSALEAALRGLIAEGGRALSAQRLGVSPAQVAWAELALGELALARRERDRARRHFARVAEMQPVVDWRLTRALVEAWLEAGDRAAARAEVERLVKRWPERRASMILLARVLLVLGEVKGAFDAVTQAGDLAGDGEALAVRSQVRLAVEDLGGATADVDAAMALSPTSLPLQELRARIELAQGRARAAVKRLAPLAGDDAPPSLRLVYAEALRRSGQRPEAQRIVAALLGEADRLASAERYGAQLEAARLELAQGRLAKARAAYQRAIDRDPGAVDARLEAALLAFDTGDAGVARAALERLAEEASSAAEVLLATARLRTLTGDPGGAVVLLDRAASLPGVPRWQLLREQGRAALRSEQPQAAVAELERAVSLAPRDTEARLLLVDAYLGAEDGAAAQRAVADIVKRFAGRAVAQLALGRLDLYERRLRDALSAFDSAHRLLVAARAMPRELGEVAYFRGRVHYVGGNLRKAREALREAVALDPSNGDALFFLGQVEFERRDFAAAAAAYQRIVSRRLSPLPSVWFYYGEALARLKRKKQAREALGAYLERDPKGNLASAASKLLKKLK